ncbi:succinate dehydrogenase cytochrome b subunit [Streptomyces smyrnaeus]|uniref:succinate dehydrogenase cytochrome b subunit n=1 Tax=Streptomyces smyrnaeus TaxID=1387713 RepID=UPI0033B24220
MATATRTPTSPGPGTRPPVGSGPGSRGGFLRTLWGSTIGKKAVMAVSGLLMLAYLLVHMLANLKVFFGPEEMNGYAHWLRTLGEPLLRHGWFLWIARAVLLAAVVLHGVSAYQLSRRGIAARPVRYRHQQRRSGYATRTMRWGGIILALFIVWHVLDLTTGTVNPRGQAGHPYENIVAGFQNWYANVIYIVAMLAVGLHIRHGFWSAAQTLGVARPGAARLLKGGGNLLALVITAGFLSVPIGVMTGVVS